MSAEAPSGGHWDALARAAAHGGEGAGEESCQLRLLSFELDDTPYALPVERVREIVRMRAVTPMPHVPDEVLGVISLRGEIVQVVDLRRRLSLPAPEPGRRTRIVLVLGADGRVTGLLVDAVTDVMSVDEEALRPPSGEAAAVEALCARGDRFVSLLDLERVLDFDGD